MNEKHDVVIVGCGPAGLYTAFHIRKRDVILLEEHEKIGFPKHCAGIAGNFVAGEVAKISPKLLDHSYRNITFVTPRKKYTVYSNVPIAFHVNRPLLEEILACKVESMGHKIFLKNRAVPRGNCRIKVKDSTIEYGVLVIADGAESVFRRALVREPADYIYGLQIVARASNPIPDDTLMVLFSELTPTFFSWIIPLDKDIVKMGLASKAPREEHIFSLVRRKLGFKVTSIVERFGGLIPIHKPLKNPIIHCNAVFHGDSVPLMKPYTGGGLYYIFKLSPILAKCIDSYSLKSYNEYYVRTFYVKNSIEQFIVKFLRKTRYFIPVPIVSELFKLGALLPEDFDEHLKIAFKALTLIPIIPILPLLSRSF